MYATTQSFIVMSVILWSIQFVEFIMLMSDLSAEEESRRNKLPVMSNFDCLQVNGAGVSWAAIFAGAVLAATVSLILFLLGSGVGLSSVSPWTRNSMDAPTLGITAIIWMTVTQMIAAGSGGYLTGRLRVKWLDVISEEVYFRDIAHGILTWAVAILATAAFLTASMVSIMNVGIQTASTLAPSAAKAGIVAVAVPGIIQAENSVNDKAVEMGYFIDTLFRKDSNGASTTSTSDNASAINTLIPTVEVARIFANSMSMESMPAKDLSYLRQLISDHTGVTNEEAETRINETYANIQTKAGYEEIAAKNMADEARKASIYTTLWLFISLLIGAFSAGLAAVWGGRCRDAQG